MIQEYANIIVTIVRDGRVYDWQGDSDLTRIPTSIYEGELRPAIESGSLPWELWLEEYEWESESVIIRRGRTL